MPERPAQRVRGPGRLEGHLRGAARRRRAGGGIEYLVGALRGRGARRGARVGQRHVAGAEGARRGGHELADGAAAADRDPAPGQAAGAQHGVARHRQRFQQRAAGVAQGIAEPVAVGGRHRLQFAQRAVGRRIAGRAAEVAHLRAQVAAPAPAPGAAQTRLRGIDRHPIAGPQALHRAPGRHHLAGNFVAEHERAGRHERPHPAVAVVVDVAAADPDPLDAQYHFVGGRRRIGPPLAAQVAPAVQYPGEHDAATLYRRRAPVSRYTQAHAMLSSSYVNHAR